MVLLAARGAALADSSLPDDDAAAVEVSALPRSGELRTVLALSQFEGCSTSYQSETEDVVVVLALEGGRARVEASGTRRSVTGGRSSENEHPRAYRDERRAVGGRWTGAATVDGDRLRLRLADAAGRPLALLCTVERVKQDGGGTIGALVCRGIDGANGVLPVGTMAKELPAIAFGRGRGYRTAESRHRYGSGGPRAPHVEVVRH
jgi:hypothetical protein